MSICDLNTESFGRTLKNVQDGQIRVDSGKQRDLFERLARTDNAIDTYKQMLVESWSMEEERAMNRTVSKISNPGQSSGQPYELPVRAKNEELPIVGYSPVFAQKSSPCRSGGKPVMNSEAKMEKTDFQKEPAISREIPVANKSDQALDILVQELKAESYVTPFDKFVPHEDQLPDLDPAVEAKLLATSEIDPVRGVFEENLDKEIADYEDLLNLPSFEQFDRGDEIPRKMKENMKFWRNISQHEKPKPPTDQELKLLDYATLCNMYTGNWGMDEDSMMLQFFYKFQYDDKWRERIKKGCFNMLDECNPQSCGICKDVTDEEVAKMKPECFFEIEDKDDYENVVMKIKEDFNIKYDDDTNWDFKQLIMNPVDSDLDSDPFVSDDELQTCDDGIPSSKEWIRARSQGTSLVPLWFNFSLSVLGNSAQIVRFDWIPLINKVVVQYCDKTEVGTWIAPKGFDVQPKDEEDLLPRDMNCEDIEFLRYRNIVPQKPGDQAALEAATLEMMRTKYEKKKADEKKGYFWRGKSNYVYRWPDFRKKPKKN